MNRELAEQLAVNFEEALDAAHSAGYGEGYRTGLDHSKMRADMATLDLQSNKLDRAERALQAQIKLINAVGQTLQQQSGLVSGLASALDNIRVL